MTKVRKTKNQAGDYISKERKKDPMEFFGIWKDMPQKEIDEIKKRLMETRKEFNESFAKRLKEYELDRR